MPISDEEAADLAINSLICLSNEQEEAYLAITRLLKGHNDDPFVDIHLLFQYFNVLYFRGLLLPRVEVSWSGRLTLCAGLCELIKDKEGRYRRIRLKLSEPLLKYRPCDDTVNTLLHEAIHAYFFIESSWQHSRNDDPSGHGAGFQRLASAINHHGSYDITVYHTFHDEVDSYRNHIWKCDGTCKDKGPYFGIVKRSMNRPPGKSDNWWKRHEQECGGNFTKISEPELTKGQINKLTAFERAGRQKNKISEWIGQKSITGTVNSDILDNAGPSSKGGHPSLGNRKRHVQDTAEESRSKTLMLTCPICDFSIPETQINDHLDLNHPL